MAYARGSVALASDPYKDGGRPFLVVSNAARPYFGRQYTVAVMTTKSRDEAVPVAESDLADGQLATYPTYVNPWALHEFDHDETYKRVAQVSGEVVERVGRAVFEFVRLPE